MVATPTATSPQGWVSGARPMAYRGDMLSRPVCHFGVFLGGLGLPILRRCRTAISTRATPMARERSHPKMKAAPLRVPPLERRIRRNAVSGMGSSVMTRPMSSRSRITSAPDDLSVPAYLLLLAGTGWQHGAAPNVLRPARAGEADL